MNVPFTYDSSDEDDDYVVSTIAQVALASMDLLSTTLAVVEERFSKKQKTDHRQQRRKPRRLFRHQEALHCIRRDYLGIAGDPTTPLLGKEFSLMFRLSRGRFQLLMQDVMRAGIPFYMSEVTANGESVASLEARLLLPLKTLAYGVPPHTFLDYFHLSSPLARNCCIEFDKAIKTIYMRRFLRLPSADDVKGIVSLHKEVHGVHGMVGSLDCSHTVWKNCPKAWQGSFKGKGTKSSIVLEAMCDYHLYFWHVSYGYAGTLNDLNILSLSPLLDRLVDGSFMELEKKAGVVPYCISNQVFDKCFLLVDGIYPRYSRFVKGIKEPISNEETAFTKWQESARKDIERAFGVLKNTWQFMDRPIHSHSLMDISARVTTCVILHNMLVSDRIMQDYNSMYNPSHLMEQLDVQVEQPNDLQQIQVGAQIQAGVNDEPVGGGIGIATAPPAVVGLLTRRDRFKDLADREQHARLHQALMIHCAS